MCGICGSLALDARPVDADGVRAMLAGMAHRGPDAKGLFEEPGIAAGIRRLAVIDVEGGTQPIASEDGGVQVVYNGEIYNFRELTRELAARGHRFRTRSDTEVLVHLWEEHGPEMVHHLQGMFAFCIHDRRSGESFIARDRLGIKPLFYRDDGRALHFASEPAVLLRHPDVPAEVDGEALIELFCLQYVSGERTVWRGVRKLPPGHALHLRGGGLRTYRYWELPPAQPGPEADPERLRGQLRELMESSVRQRLVADVPLGMFLSGGIDSSIGGRTSSREGQGRHAHRSRGLCSRKSQGLEVTDASLNVSCCGATVLDRSNGRRGSRDRSGDSTTGHGPRAARRSWCSERPGRRSRPPCRLPGTSSQKPRGRPWIRSGSRNRRPTGGSPIALCPPRASTARRSAGSRHRSGRRTRLASREARCTTVGRRSNSHAP
jgi:asparagine synthetase B (glutamine-hydrolysing)